MDLYFKTLSYPQKILFRGSGKQILIVTKKFADIFFESILSLIVISLSIRD